MRLPNLLKKSGSYRPYLFIAIAKNRPYTCNVKINGVHVFVSMFGVVEFG
jgi:hypothetical protein